MEPSLLKEKDPMILEAFFSLSFFFFFFAVTHAFPSLIKGEAGRPMKGIQIRTRPNHEIKTPEHDTSTRLSGNRALSTRSLLPPETWDYFLSRLFVTSTANQVPGTRAAVN